METRRVYRQWERPDCPINILHFRNHRVMDLFSPHLHDDFEIYYIIRGEYEIFSPEGNFKLAAESAYTILPNEVHSIRSLKNDGEYISVAVGFLAVSMMREHFLQKEFVDPLRKGQLKVPRILQAKDPACAELFGYLRHLVSLDKTDPQYTSKKFLFTMGVCTELMAQCVVLNNRFDVIFTESNIAKKCAKYMNEHYSEKISLKILAEYVHVHPNYLCAAFKKNVGVTVLEYLNRIRVERARELLEGRNMNISQVAEQCGFRSISSFQRSFKVITGITPSSYARNIKRSISR